MAEERVDTKPEITPETQDAVTEQKKKAKPFEMERYFAISLDPVHVGTGGYRLGRVDNTIVREPGTNVPKIPGSSIAGVTRAYTAMAVQGDTELPIGSDNSIDFNAYKRCKYLRPAYKFAEQVLPDRLLIKRNDEGKLTYQGKDPTKYFSCAGKGAEDGDGHCGEPDCEVCVTFGFSKKKSSFQGLAQFHDARILFFPVYTMIGPVWITCPSILAYFNQQCHVDPEKFRPINTTTPPLGGRLNFGWLLLEQDSTGPFKIDFSTFSESTPLCKKVYEMVFERTFVVSDRVFSQIVNDNLEVRTSVAIDPQTGAAEEGALFTYEAIPRATVFWFEVVFSNPRHFKIDGKKTITMKSKDEIADSKNLKEEEADIPWLKTNVKNGLKYFETLGIGGMNTRGMGRIRVFFGNGKEE